VHRQPDLVGSVCLGAALAVTALASGYYGVFAGGVTALSALVWARKDPRYWISLAGAAAVTAALVLPVLVPYIRDRAAAGPMRTTSIEELRGYSATPRDYITTGTRLGEAGLAMVARVKQHVIPRVPIGRATENLFPGLVVVFLALAALARIAPVPADPDRHDALGYGAIAVFAAWGSFGPHAGLYAVMMRVLPGMSLLRAPARLGPIVIFALAMLAGFGLSRLERGRRWLGPVSVAVLVLELWVPWPVRAMAPPERAYRMLASLPRGGVLELPFHYLSSDFHEHTRAMARSIVNWQPLLNGYSDFIPDDFYALAMPITNFPDAASFAILREHSVKYVIIRMGEYNAYRQTMLDRFPPYERYLHKLTDDDDVWLYEIVAWPEGISSAAAGPGR
jgi:hypothetical protein